jgi:hypothetical protein
MKALPVSCPHVSHSRSWHVQHASFSVNRLPQSGHRGPLFSTTSLRNTDRAAVEPLSTQHPLIVVSRGGLPGGPPPRQPHGLNRTVSSGCCNTPILARAQALPVRLVPAADSLGPTNPKESGPARTSRRVSAGEVVWAVCSGGFSRPFRVAEERRGRMGLGSAFKGLKGDTYIVQDIRLDGGITGDRGPLSPVIGVSAVNGGITGDRGSRPRFSL